MAVPSTVPELVERIRRSGLVPPDRLEGFLTGLAASGNDPADVPDLLARLVDAGMITHFHADRLAAGKYKGFILGSYLILELIGSGGMGQVYLAEHTSMKRLVALKVLPVVAADSVEDKVARERFLREARVAATLDHPNIVRVFDLCQEGRLMYLVMEYVEGVSLQAMVAKTGPLPVAAAANYARQVAFGLQHAHELGCVHRDIKPANLLIDRAGVAKILDLGLVRSESDADNGLTRKLDHKGVLGTADYVAPEQAVDSSNVDPRADIYSLGATLYFLLAGRPLFPEGRTAQKLVWQQIRDPAPINRIRTEVPEELALIIHKMIQKKPADRYASATEVFEALEPWAQEAVPPPDELLIPKSPLRVASAKSGVHGVSQKLTSSTSHLLTAAMRSGSGMGRPSSGGGASSGGSSSHRFITPGSLPTMPGAKVPDTGAVAMDETQRSRPGVVDRSCLEKDDVPAVNAEKVPPSTITLHWQTIALAGGLLLAAGMAVGGLVLLLLRGSH